MKFLTLSIQSYCNQNMPQESLRSVVYRSFVTCENPRGVVEGKTIRISKANFRKMKRQMKSSKEKEKMSLVEVKNGAQKLNETIDSWSNGTSFESKPKDIANDLLKGALDLQESLMMLGKLQEASSKASFKKKHDIQNEDHVGRIGSDRFESFRIYDSGYQKERKLANGSSRDCFAELREVIKEGLSKQNLLPPNKAYEESVFKGTRKLQLSPDIASTSSSRSSSMVNSTQEFTSSESFSSRTTEEKSKRSNLIAKLMGLEEFPSKPIRKQLDISSKSRPVFDLDLPNVKKPRFLIQKSDQEHVSKAFLRSNNREIERSSKRFIDDVSPIVLMRPQRFGDDKQNVKVYDNPIRKLHQEKAKTEDKSVKNRGKSKLPSNKQKVSVPVVPKPQRKQELEKKLDKIQKPAPLVEKKPGENAKSTRLMPKDESLRQVKPQRRVHKLKNQMKNIKIEKPVNEASTSIIDSPNQEETQDSRVATKEAENVRHQSLYEAFGKDSYHVRDVITGTDQSETRNNEEESSACGASDLNEHKSRILKTLSNFQDFEPANSELIRDCVNEILEHENQQQNPLIPRSILPSRICTSKDHLTREIAKKFENLRDYSKVSASSNADTISVFLEKDLNLTTIGGAWGTTGWRDGCTLNEIEEVVLDLEKMVLSKLIDDILLELVSNCRFV